MRRLPVVLAALVLGGCAMPARADYLFDFYFGSGDFDNGLVVYGPTEVVYRATTLGPSTLVYVRGDINGYAPATVNSKTYLYEGRPDLPKTDYSQQGPLDGPAFAVGGFDMALNDDVTSPGLFTDIQSRRSIEVPHSFFTPGASGYAFDPVYTFGTVNVTELPLVTPEPGTWGLVGTGVLGLVGVGRRRFAEEKG